MAALRENIRPPGTEVNRGGPRFPLLFLYGLLTVFRAHAEYPEIRALSVRDHLFVQLQEDISGYHRAAGKGSEPPPLAVYRYVTAESTDLFALAARANLPYETLASINRIDRSGPVEKGRTLLIPNLPGLFIPLRPENDLEQVMVSWRKTDEGSPVRLLLPGGREPVPFMFLPGERFHTVERAYFLGILFRFPLPVGRISSGYGSRLHPVTGEQHFHGGIDIAAPVGTEVFAARSGTVIRTGTDPVYGIHVLLSHEGDFLTLYGHLESVFVELHDTVSSGTILGTVGTTGMTTGPHLHFEIRKGGRTRDPIELLPGNTR